MIALPLVALLLAAPAGAPAAKAPAAAVTVPWERGFKAALAKAKAAGKPVMIDFWAEWCGYCHLLDKTTYRDPTVVRSAGAGFVSVKVNAEGNAEEQSAASRYMIGSLPTILFVSPAGRPILRLDGYLPPARFVGALGEASRRAPLVMNLETTLEKDPQNAEALAALGLHVFKEMTLLSEHDAEGRMSKQMFEDARDLLSRAARVDTARPPLERKRVRSSLGMAYGFEGKFPEAEAMLKEAIALSPADAAIDARANAKLAQVYLMQKKNDLASQTFRNVIARYPQSPEAVAATEYLEVIKRGSK